DYTTWQMTVSDEFRGPALLYFTLKKILGQDFSGRRICPDVLFTRDKKSAIFELPNKYEAKLIHGWRDTNRMSLKTITKLPEID
ncbi:unnamed protein product, partial [Didymodactylos carnosus]